MRLSHVDMASTSWQNLSVDVSHLLVLVPINTPRAPRQLLHYFRNTRVLSVVRLEDRSPSSLYSVKSSSKWSSCCGLRCWRFFNSIQCDRFTHCRAFLSCLSRFAWSTRTLHSTSRPYLATTWTHPSPVFFKKIREREGLPASDAALNGMPVQPC